MALAIVAMPVVAPLLVGAAIHVRVPPIPAATRAAVREAPGEFAERRDKSTNAVNIQVPLEFWRHASGDAAPRIKAPWGESVQPALHQFLQISFYNPYSVDPRNTDRFREWQFTRATRAVYGEALTPAQLSDAMRSGLRPVEDQPRMQLLYLGATLIGALAFLWILEVPSWYVFSRYSRRMVTSVFTTIFLAGLLLCLGADFIYKTGAEHLTTAFFQGSVLRLSLAIPNGGLLAAGFLAAIAALWWILLKQFARSEPTCATQTQCAR